MSKSISNCIPISIIGLNGNSYVYNFTDISKKNSVWITYLNSDITIRHSIYDNYSGKMCIGGETSGDETNINEIETLIYCETNGNNNTLTIDLKEDADFIIEYNEIDKDKYNKFCEDLIEKLKIYN